MRTRTLKYGWTKDLKYWWTRALKYGWTRTLKYFLAAAFLFLAGCARQGGEVVVEEFQSRVMLGPGGAVEVDETFTLVAGSGSFVYHGVADRHDGVSNVTATIDGRPAAMGDAHDQVHIEPGLALDVTSSVPFSGVRTLGLHYQARGTVHVAGLRGTFTWHALPGQRAFSVRAARIVLTLPPGTTTISDIHIQEPDWTITRTAEGAVAEKAGVPANESVTIVAQFAIDAGSIARPVWQENMERGQLLLPAFISAGLLILVVGVGSLVMVRLQSPGWSVPERETARTGLRRGGLAIVVFGLLAAIIFPMFFGQFGRAPMAIPVSIILVGLMLTVSGRWALGTTH